MGTNDFAESSRTLAQLQADYTTLVALCHNRGMKVISLSMLPRTTSTDNWATLANQTPVSASFNAGANSPRGQFNTWLAAFGPGNDYFLDATSQAESSPQSGLWVVNGTANYATSDGVHPQSGIYQLIGALVSALLPSLTLSVP
jgi:hypothetical protein